MTILEKLLNGQPVSDEDFNVMYPPEMKVIADFHYTPIDVAQVAAAFLAPEPGKKILDIGSGGGKFCMIGSATTQGHFTGIEQRKELHELALSLTEKNQWPRVSFQHGNMMEVPFKSFDGIYYFNSFFEHLIPEDAIDNSISFSRTRHATYVLYVKQQLAMMPEGTRLVTYFSYANMIPWTYESVGTDFDGKLIKWIKRPIPI
ncbi:MAG: class I SAM-dependent methyltransferase [Saprospiraceae bacterium]|nr:class I SAM-dependent methyltransferase [Saprospiraceae bacterium]